MSFFPLVTHFPHVLCHLFHVTYLRFRTSLGKCNTLVLFSNVVFYMITKWKIKGKENNLKKETEDTSSNQYNTGSAFKTLTA